MKKYTINNFKPIFDFIEGAVGPGKFPSGVFGVADRDGIIGIQSYGSRPDGKRVKEDDIYLLFSVSKVITSLALMQLCEQGKLHLDEVVERIIPGFGVNGKDKMTVWHLLTHTSGMQQGALDSMLGERKGAEFDLNEEFIRVGTDFPCGSCKSYNPYMAFSVIGEIIKRITGMGYDEYMKKNIFEPLEMYDTSFDKFSEVPERVIPIINESGLFDMENYAAAKLPAAGIFSTAHDLLLLGRVLINNGIFNGYKLISNYTLKQMTTPQTIGIPYFNPGKNMTGVEIGLGFVLPVNRHSIIKRNIYGHNGAGDCMFWVHPDEGVAFVFMANYDCEEDPQGADIEYIHNVFSSCLNC